MLLRLSWIGIFFALVGVAHAASLRVSAESPLSGQRLGDAIRTYVDGTEVTVEAPQSASDGAEARPGDPGTTSITLRKSHTPGEESDVVLEVVLIDGEETIIARLPGALRTEDLYRAAALKVQALLQRRAAPLLPAAATVAAPTADPHASAPAAPAGSFLLDVGLALMLPSGGPSREALRVGAGLSLGNRWRMGLGAYLEPRQSSNVQGIEVSSWEIPLWLSLGFAWHTGKWQGWLETVGHAAIHTVSAKGAEIASNSDTTVSPRAGAALGFAVAIARGLSADARASLLAVLADRRYLVDGQVAWPAARALVLVELGLLYGAR